MWARVLELMFACWLTLSPFIFRHPVEERFLWTHDLICGALVIFFSLLSFWPPLEKIHLLILLIGGWLIGVAFSRVPSPAVENHLIIGLFLAMLSLIPCQAESPPRKWVEFLAKKEKSH